ncbi:M48 family metallopeptidase [Porphyromonas circumdentaria]|uniref:M48 family metallopeptidase n=1 Tax=Porphyromonas circumdentaria TaxID=29524 RepID=UPI0026DDC6F6|nr:M48 family metallopeptidase [Porphyromonas circumdentaria]MDO4722451.1 M48 family metallopeptidase [Porphyromonas circumdentaria]
MRRKYLSRGLLRLLLATFLTSTFFSACRTVPVSGRRSLNLVSETEIIQTSKAQYVSYIAEMPHSNDPAKVKRVEKVCRDIADATTKYLQSNGMEALARQMEWQFTLIADRRVNAFCMPGGKIVIYTGILSLCATDAELATVVSHEVSHAIAQHSNERLSTEILRRMGASILGQAVGSTSALTKTVIQQAYGLGSQVLISLPYSRTQEHEADQIGLVFMAMAGYNPQEAISFWTKMSQQGGSNSFDLLSTHPSDEKRIQKIKEYMPNALPYYEEYKRNNSIKSLPVEGKKEETKKKAQSRPQTKKNNPKK